MNAQCPEIVGSLSGGTYQCRRPAGHYGGHTNEPDASTPRLGSSLDLPFEKQPTTTGIDLSDGRIAGGLVIMAAALPVPGVGVKPALVYRFATPDGDFYPPMVLVVDEDQMTKLAQLTASASAAAIASTHK